jgi:hypothetical protein
MDSTISNQRICRVRTARLALWLDGELEFPVTFQELTRAEQEKIRNLIGEIVVMLENHQPDPLSPKEQIAALDHPGERKTEMTEMNPLSPGYVTNMRVF